MMADLLEKSILYYHGKPIGTISAQDPAVASLNYDQCFIRDIEQRWQNLIGDMPVKICYPAISSAEWRIVTGCDPQNSPWSYHNGGNWPFLIWAFAAAAHKLGRVELATRAIEIADRRRATYSVGFSPV
jgi:hypothetical protein